MSNGFMLPGGGSSLPDRNTVGKNGAIGINSGWPDVALNVGNNVQVTNALDGNTYLAMQPPEGEYSGESYVGTPRINAASAIVAVMNTIKANNDEQGTNKTFTYTAILSEGIYIYFLCGATQKDNGAQWSTCDVTYDNGSVDSAYFSKPTNTFTSAASGVIHSNGSGFLTAKYYGGDTTRKNAAVFIIYKIG